MNPYYEDASVHLYHGDALAVLRELPDASVNCCVTSPPYFGLRDYGVEGQYGLESSPAEYVETMRALFAEVRRVLTDDGTLWLNIGDSYAGQDSSAARTKSASSSPASISASPLSPSSADSQASNADFAAAIQSSSIGPLSGMKQGARNGNRRSRPRGYEGLPAKNLMGIPWRTAFALQDDGWILRNDIIWTKPNAMPESVTDRLSTKHEHMFMFAKSTRYWFDLDPIRELYHGDRAPSRRARSGNVNKPNSSTTPWSVDGNPGGKNPGDVWTIPTQPFASAHFAVMPPSLASRAIQAGCKPDGVVLDPFSGSGTTGLAAAKHGRRYVGIDLNAEYLDLSLRTRLAQSAIDFSEATA